MSTETVNCTDVIGKTVKSLKLYSTDTSAAEILIEFTDGTSFSSTYESRSVLKASLIRGGEGAPELLSTYCE